MLPLIALLFPTVYAAPSCPSVTLSGSGAFLAPLNLVNSVPAFASEKMRINFAMDQSVVGRKITFSTNKGGCTPIVMTPGAACTTYFEIPVNTLSTCFDKSDGSAGYSGTVDRYAGAIKVLIEDPLNQGTVTNRQSFDFNFGVLLNDAVATGNSQVDATISITYALTNSIYNKVKGVFEVTMKSSTNFPYLLPTDKSQMVVSNVQGFPSVNLVTVVNQGNCDANSALGSKCDQNLNFEITPSTCQSKTAGGFSFTASQVCRRNSADPNKCLALASPVTQNIVFEISDLCANIAGELIPQTLTSVVNTNENDATNGVSSISSLDTFYVHLAAPTGTLVNIKTMTVTELCIRNNQNTKYVCVIENGAPTTLGQLSGVGLATSNANPQNSWVKLKATIDKIEDYDHASGNNDGLFIAGVDPSYAFFSKITYNYDGVSFQQLVKRDLKSATATSVSNNFKVTNAKMNGDARVFGTAIVGLMFAFIVIAF